MTWYRDFQVSLHTFEKNIIGVLRQRSPGRSCPGPGFHKKLRRELSNALSEVPAPVKSTTSCNKNKALISQFKRTVAFQAECPKKCNWQHWQHCDTPQRWSHSYSKGLPCTKSCCHYASSSNTTSTSHNVLLRSVSITSHDTILRQTPLL